MENLLNYDRPALAHFFAVRGQQAYRAEQVFRRLHRGQQPPHIFADLPAALRAELCEQTTCSAMPIVADSTAADGVRKWLFDAQGARIETVIIPESRRQTLCISSQAGCALACRFCLTGKQGFSRNLSTAEIIGQLRQANAMLAQPITNVVMMGMGEPLLNLDAVLPALNIMTDAHGFALPPKRVTVSTAGIVPAMSALSAKTRVSLAVSLHAATDSLRDDLMPINRKYPLRQLMDACRRHIQLHPRAFVTFEYVMLQGINDSPSCARDVVRLLHGVRCKVNLIPFNVFDGTEYTPSPLPAIHAFRDGLLKSRVMTTIRKTRGHDILAACGQLAGDIQPRTMGLGGRARAKNHAEKIVMPPPKSNPQAKSSLPKKQAS